MIGVLFHGPEVFDKGWAARIIKIFSGSDIRLMLAGTMARTALFDSGIEGVETPGLQPSQCVKLLEKDCSLILLATFGKSPRSGLIFGSMVANHAASSVPMVQVECSGSVYSELSGVCPAEVIRKFEKLGFSLSKTPKAKVEVWTEKGTTCRRMTTSEKGDFILVNGIVVGKALGTEVVLVSKNRSIIDIRGVQVKEHGLEKLERFGGVDLALVKLASTCQLRGETEDIRVKKLDGHGMAFVDHAGMDIYKLARGVEGAVTVGDDTTAVVGDILYRFGLPIIGIVDGDGDEVMTGTKLCHGSTIFTVKSDDLIGLKIFKKLFKGKIKSKTSFVKIKIAIDRFIALDIISRKDY